MIFLETQTTRVLAQIANLEAVTKLEVINLYLDLLRINPYRNK